MLPYNSIPFVREFNRYSVSRTVKRMTHELGMVHPILVSTVPNACDYVSLLEPARVIYYCVDDFAQWPGLDQDLIRNMEEQLIGKADVLVATSQNLFQKLATSGKSTHLLTHGVDLSLFTREAPMEHECLAGIPRPRAGYFGLFDERSDQSVIAGVASHMKDFSFVITGPVATDVATLRAHSNIYFTGSVPYADLPAIIKGFDVLFIPYVVNGFTDSISPLKLKEYLVTGKPVITTPMAETILQGQYLTIASTVDEWKAALHSALSVDIAARRQSIVEVMAGESWEKKAQRFLNICTNSGYAPQGAPSR
jgi:glycosyltransferase involved in cell wall biosynthesis